MVFQEHEFPFASLTGTSQLLTTPTTMSDDDWLISSSVLASTPALDVRGRNADLSIETVSSSSPTTDEHILADPHPVPVPVPESVSDFAVPQDASSKIVAASDVPLGKGLLDKRSSV